MKLMLMYYDRSLDALNKGADIEKNRRVARKRGDRQI